MEATAAVIWEQVLTDIRSEVGETRFNLWFTNTVAVDCKSDSLTVGVPSTFVAEWLETHYARILAASASRRLGCAVKPRFVVDGGLFRGKVLQESVAKNELLDEVAPAAPADFEASKYTLENFVVGPCNSVAYAAVRKVIESPGKAYNPLFLHGGVGLGKTHLLVAIANSIKGNRRRGTIEYVSAEAFTNRFIAALKYGSLDAFRARYRKTKLLVIDDVHFLANKPATQDEFLNTFNALSRDGAQIVMASDSHPKLIAKLKETLVTRFLSGMVARLDKPGYQTRLEILNRKCARRNLVLAPEVSDFVARRLKGSVREIEGAVNTLAAVASISRAPVTSAIASEVLRSLIDDKSRPVRLPEIDSVVSAYSGLPEGQIRSARRTRSVSQARHIAMYLARQLGGFSYEEIGTYFGGRNHSSVVAAVGKISRMTRDDGEFAREVSALKSEFAQ